MCKFNTRILFVLLIVSLSVPAFAIEYFNIKGRVKDNTYDTDVIGAKITLYDIADSTVATQTEASASWYARYSGNWKEYKSSEFSFNNLPCRKRYMMEVAYEGYDTLLAMIDPASISSRQDMMGLAAYI